MTSFRKYFITMILVFGFCLFCFGIFVFFLYRAHEISNYEDIIAFQNKNDAIYLSSINGDTFRYKLTMIKIDKPDVIALGSSHAMYLQRENFNVPFVCAGGAMNSLKEGKEFLLEMLKAHQPKVVLLVLDLPWFADDYSIGEDYSDHQEKNETKITRNKISTTLSTIFKGKISFQQIKEIIFKNLSQHPLTSRNLIGLGAMQLAGGFQKDGSAIWYQRVAGFDKTDLKFEQTLNQVRNGKDRFPFAKIIDPKKVTILEDILQLLRSHQVTPIIIIPPVAPLVFKEMKNVKEKTGYIEKAGEMLKSLDVDVYDFLDVSSLGSSDCEFFDGNHGGNIVFQRILMAVKNPVLKSYLNYPFLKKNIREGSGFVTKFDSSFKYEIVDFLDLGCPNRPRVSTFPH